ncbi:MAG: hypothetical protein II872_01235 [Clostridia bacterium]|nr:hypothetical protein [Clostridia bacterium]
MMKRFFLIPLLAMLLAFAGCSCSVRGDASMPTKAPTMKPAASAAPAATASPAATPPETAAPVEPTTPAVSPSSGMPGGNG